MSRAEKTRSLPDHRDRGQEDCLIIEGKGRKIAWPQREKAGRLPGLSGKRQENCLIREERAGRPPDHRQKG